MVSSRPVDILIVDDSAEDLELALRALRKADLAPRVEVARDGQDALDFLFGTGPYAGQFSEHRPGVVLLDLKLPKIDGLEVLQRMKTDDRTKTIPAVVLTSSSERADILRSYELGVNSYVVKPVNSDQFSAAVQEVGHYWLLLNRRPLADA